LNRSNDADCRQVEEALMSLRNGSGVLITDDDNRENEGDLIFPAETLTEAQMAMLIRECSGIVCLCLTPEKVESLGLRMMVDHNTSTYGTAFTISVDAAQGVTTGVSAADRLRTVKTALPDDADISRFAYPGHVFPLRARPGGVIERQGHTEATVDIMRLSGFKPCGVLCELTNSDGTMARYKEVKSFSDKHTIPMVTIENLVKYRKANSL